MKLSYDDFDLSGVRTVPLASRDSKARHEDFARPWDPAAGMGGWFQSLPRMLAAADLVAVVAAMRRAQADERALVWGLGAHVIKAGLAPVLIDLMERGFVSAIALNGAGMIHDFEVALAGATSEDVDASLGPGRFGMAEETGRGLNEAIVAGAARGLGLGQAAAEYLAGHQPRFGRVSLLCAAARLGVPVTVHVGVGTDIIHMHPALHRLCRPT